MSEKWVFLSLDDHGCLDALRSVLLLLVVDLEDAPLGMVLHVEGLEARAELHATFLEGAD